MEEYNKYEDIFNIIYNQVNIDKIKEIVDTEDIMFIIEANTSMILSGHQLTTQYSENQLKEKINQITQLIKIEEDENMKQVYKNTLDLVFSTVKYYKYLITN